MAHASPMAVDRRGSASPAPQQPLSKRDKRRNNITDRLSDMIETFSSDQHQHYRAQLQAIQVDMTLILRANPYNNEPLDDSAQDIEQEIEAITGGNLPQMSTDAARRDYMALAGRRYHDYVQEINRAMEQRDADLTALKNRFDGATAELERSTSYKIQVAQREHIELASTIRSRLINTVTKKRDKLLREKEQLDIADSSALFLHPSQFTMNIPGSPGGALNPRKTRHMRHRIGDQDDAAAAAAAAAAADRGRKRKLPADDDANDSPQPSFRPLSLPSDNAAAAALGAASPFRDARDAAIYAQYEAPVFSIDRLFTDKELAHATTVASIATHQFFHHHQHAAPLSTDPPPPPHANGHGHANASAMSLDALADAASGQEAAASHANATPPPSQLQAPEMERTVSHHATRNATRTNPLAALSEAAAMTSKSTFTPHLIPITRTDKGAPTPPGVDAAQAESDITLMFKEDDASAPSANGITSNPYHPDDPDNAADGAHGSDITSLRVMRERFLEQACRDPLGNSPFRLPLAETGPAHINFKEGVARIPAYGYADPASMRFHMPNGGAVNSSTSAVGAPALPLVNENLSAVLAGGEPMSRNTSFAGSEAAAPASSSAAAAHSNGHGNANGGGAATSGPADSGPGGPAMRRVRNRLI